MQLYNKKTANLHNLKWRKALLCEIFVKDLLKIREIKIKVSVFENEIAFMSGKEAEVLLRGIKVTVFGRDTAVAEGIKGVRRIGESEMEFFYGKSKVLIRGNGLKIAHLGKGIAVVVGNIDGVDYLEK